MADKMEVIYYEMVKMEDRLTEKAEQVFKAQTEIVESLNKFEILQKELIEKIDSLQKQG
jgi:hypothetical protein